MANIYAVGAAEVMGVFRAVGAEVASADTASDVEAALHAAGADGEARLVLVSEEAAAQATEAVDRLREARGAIVLVLPSHRGASGRPVEEIRALVARAVGIDLMAGEE